MFVDQQTECRTPHTVSLSADLVVVGGGLAGTCCAITAARAGVKVVLIQDRPVLGGNASSEVRLWVLGATSHLGNNNRWSREGGVIDELLVENLFRNPEGNPLIFDTIVLEKVVEEPNITLLLNTAVFEVSKRDADAIAGVRAFCSQNSTMYEVSGSLFCDASGDGILGFLAGAAFRMGAERADEFGEKFAPREGYGELLGHTIYFYSKDVGQPVKFVPPSFALRDIRQIPRWRNFNTREFGCQLWWIEYGGRQDTVHDAEGIKWELWKIVYGVWNHIKNSGEFPEAETLTLEWVGTIPGKRESRRFEGDYILVQQDIVEQRRHYDAVAHGGWAIDLHPADGVFSEKPGCNQWHSKGIYQIPYRCMYSRNIRNLFLAGRIISASHVAFASSRVMATCAAAAQAVGMAAALCVREKLLPRDLADAKRITTLQRELLRAGQCIPHVEVPDEKDLATRATVVASSRVRLSELPPGDRRMQLNRPRAMLLPVQSGAMPSVTLYAEVKEPTELTVELRTSGREGNFTPDVVLSRRVLHVAPAEGVTVSRTSRLATTAAGIGGNGKGATAVVESETPASLQPITVDFGVELAEARYVMICVMPNPAVALAASEVRVTGVLSLEHRSNHRVAEGATQTPPEDIGVEEFEFWLPERRPAGHNFALRCAAALEVFAPENITRGPDRPTVQPNAWVADPHDERPWVELRWDEPQRIARIELAFDTDFDHPVESVLMSHPEREMPFCVRRWRLLDGSGRELAGETENHQTRRIVRLAEPVRTRVLRVEIDHPSCNVPASLMRVRCYAD